MSPETQSKLVKAVIERKFEPLGSNETVRFDTRIIAATSKNPKDLIVQGKFREDLFFKLNVIPMAIPPLRERNEDIGPLITYFLRYYCREYGKKPKTMNADALAAFLNYAWPGNVSELMNVIETVRDHGRGRGDRRRPSQPSRRNAGAGTRSRASRPFPSLGQATGTFRAEIHPPDFDQEPLGHGQDRGRARARRPTPSRTRSKPSRSIFSTDNGAMPIDQAEAIVLRTYQHRRPGQDRRLPHARTKA